MQTRWRQLQMPVCRRLACAALGYAAGTATAQYLFLPGRCLPMVLVLAALAGVGCFLKGGLRQRTLLLCIPMMLGLVWSGLHFQWFVLPSETLVGEEVTISGTVTDYVEDFGTYRRITIRQTGENAPKVKTILYDYDGFLPEHLTPGDTITAAVKVTSALTVSGEWTDYFTADGIFQRAYLKGEAAVTESKDAAIRYLPVRICHRLVSAVETAFPRDVHGLVTPLLTGDRTALYADSALYTDMKLSGVVHVVAISGMHIALLCAFLVLLFGRHRAAMLGIPALWMFAAVAGLNPSVVRAAFMYTLLLLAPLLKRDADPITSLSAALMLLLVINPCAIKSVGLQLTFAATAGLLLFTPRIFAWFQADAERRAAKQSKLSGGAAKCWNRGYHFLAASISATIGANVFTVPLVAHYFGYVAVYAFLTNLLVIPVVTLLFCGGYLITLITLAVPGIGALLGRILAWAARYAVWVIHRIADLPYSAVYTTNPLIVIWLAAAYVLLLAAWCFRNREKRFRPVVPVCMIACMLCAVLLSEAVFGAGESSVNVLDVGQGQSIALFSGRTTLLVDCGGRGNGEAGETAAAYLHGHGRDTIDALILTHLHADHTNGVEALYNHLNIRRMILPESADDRDAMLEPLLKLAQAHGTEVYRISGNTTVTIGELTIPLYVSGSTGSSANERGLLLLAKFGEFEALITGDADTEIEMEFLKRRDLPDIELLLVGHHGSKYATCQLLLDKLQPEAAAISVGYNNYGHPTEEVLERLRAFGIPIYRTDLDGTITIKAG